MQAIEFKIPRKGRLVLLGWAGGAGSVLLPFFMGQSLRASGMAGGLLVGILGWIWWYSGRYYLTVRLLHTAQGSRLLCLHSGRLMRQALYLPYGALTAFGCYSTPLLRLAGCQILVCHTAKHTFWFLPFARQDLALLCQWLETT